MPSLFDALITILGYEIIPVIIMIFFKNITSKKLIKTIAILNSVIVFIVFRVAMYIMGYYLSTNTAPAFLYGIINYYLMKNNYHIKTETTVKKPFKDKTMTKYIVGNDLLEGSYTVIPNVVGEYYVYDNDVIQSYTIGKKIHNNAKVTLKKNNVVYFKNCSFNKQ